VGQIPNSSRRDAHISRALNEVRKRSTAEEITELLNRGLDSDDRSFQTKEVAEWLENSRNAVLTLYIGRGLVSASSLSGVAAIEEIEER
jgi:hypothetical protein